MNRERLRDRMPKLVSNHLPSNARTFKWKAYSATPQSGTFGYKIDPRPFEGKVVEIEDDIILVKVARSEFAVLDRNFVQTEVKIGDKVYVSPYARRRFDRLRADTPEKSVHTREDGTSYSSTTVIIGAAPSKLPIPAPQCPELADMIQQLEELTAPDGFRKITHMLVDAKADNFSWTDPAPEDIISTPPAIRFTVNTKKFVGTVAIIYDRGADAYVIEFQQGYELVKRVDDVYFDMLGEILAIWLDDGTWKTIEVTVLDAKSSTTRKKKAD